MDTKKFKTREQFARELNLSSSSFYRKMKTMKLVIPKGLLSPAIQKMIKERLGVE